MLVCNCVGTGRGRCMRDCVGQSEYSERELSCLPQFNVSALCGCSVRAHGVDTEFAGVWAGISSALYVDCVGV